MIKVKKVSELEQVSEGNKWLVEGLWLTEGIGILAAQPKTGKSWLGLDIALSVATGTPCLGKYEVKNAHKVLFFNAEDTEAIQRDRFELIKKSRGADLDLSNLNVMTAENGIRLDTVEGIESLRAVVEEFRPALMILDPFVRMHQVSESDSTAIAKILGELRKIKNDFNCGVLLVHHSTKGSKAIRGSTEFPAWGETNLFMYKDKEESVYLDIQHRAADSVNGVPLKIGKVKDGVCLHVIDNTEAAYIQEQVKTVLGLEDSIISMLSYRKPMLLDALVSTLKVERKEVLDKVYRLIKDGQIKHTNQGYIRL
jgi:hypothetical protein